MFVSSHKPIEQLCGELWHSSGCGSHQICDRQHGKFFKDAGILPGLEQPVYGYVDVVASIFCQLNLGIVSTVHLKPCFRSLFEAPSGVLGIRIIVMFCHASTCILSVCVVVLR